ncbi:hypothetical protein PVAG01_04865 [Phlyctema vagabunda]|uniref:Uncharacterized protein n=1 Tax=Phlyctema vagabunda TaxID=108571 RepID=A0ABR4PIG2_9HELO
MCCHNKRVGRSRSSDPRRSCYMWKIALEKEKCRRDSRKKCVSSLQSIEMQSSSRAIQSLMEYYHYDHPSNSALADAIILYRLLRASI